MEEKIEELLSYFYRSTHIPVSYYDEYGCICSYIPVVFQPDLAYCYLKNAIESQKSEIGYLCNCDVYFGFIHIFKEKYLLLGPVRERNVSRNQCIKMLKELNISLTKIQEIEYLFNKIPVINRSRFLSTLNFLNYLLGNNLKFQPTDVSEGYILTKPSLPELKKNEWKDMSPFHDTKDIEQRLMTAISFGKSDELLGILKKLTGAQLSVGQVAESGLRATKNIFISAIAIISRIAIQVGMDYDQSLTLSDYYIQKIELMSNVPEIFIFLGSMMFDYCNRIQKIRQYGNCSPLTHAVIDDIQRNIYQPLLVIDIAKRVGFSVSYISAIFKKEIGISLKEFIQQEKIREAKYLLSMPDASISEVSEKLNYSSVSHFQTAFKKITEMTPGQYLKQQK